MDLASLFALAAGSSVLGGLVTVLGNGIFGWAKGRADTNRTKADTAVAYGEMYGKMYADFAKLDTARAMRDDQRIRELVDAIERLTDSVDRVVPLLDHIAANGEIPDRDNVRAIAADLREMNRVARIAI